MLNIQKTAIEIQKTPNYFYLSNENFVAYKPIIDQQFNLRNTLDPRIAILEIKADTLVGIIERQYYSP